MEHIITITRSGVRSAFKDTAEQMIEAQNYALQLMQQGIAFTYTTEC